MDSSFKISRAAIGRSARFGDLYDAKEDTFLNVNIFKSALEGDDIIEDEVNDNSIDIIFTDSLEEKFNKLDIDAELGLSIICGLVKVEGTAAYLDEENNRAKLTSSATLTYAVRTIHEEVDGIRSKVNRDVLETVEATHVVVGIDWGARCNVTCEYENKEYEDKTEVNRTLLTEIDYLKSIVSESGKTNVDFEKQDRDSEATFLYHSTTDVSDLDADIPSTFEAAVHLVTGLPSVVKKRNGGKGLPISFTMLSLDKVRKMCKMQEHGEVKFKQIPEDAVKRCFQTLEKVADTRRKLNELLRDLSRNQNVILGDNYNRARDLQDRFKISEAKFMSALKANLVAFRSENMDISFLHAGLTYFLDGEHSPVIIEKEIGKFDFLLEKIKLVCDLNRRDVFFIGRNTTCETALAQYSDKNVYMLYFDYSSKMREPKLWQQETDLFYRLIKTHKEDTNFKFIVVDCEIQPEARTKDRMYIEYFENGVICCENVFIEEGQDLEHCTIKMNIVEPLKAKPNARVLMEIRCPKSFSGKCSSENCQWVCQKCKECIEYGIKDKKFYCKCGAGTHTGIMFRCNDPNHGLAYVAYQIDYLEKILVDLGMVKETNILILGETGVGKSTWINAMANYLAFPTLQEATRSKEMKVLIPTKFSFTSETGKTIDIEVGSTNSNEVTKAGQSCTQGPKAYKFCVGNHAISLIDTPGIGDVRGLEQDEKNFEMILSHLSYYQEIHGICILLKPNSSRLTVTFRFCVTELLTHLHKSAADNIIFCFTNARSTFYRPGDTLPVLQALISEYKGATMSVTPNNQFCFDNEAFRFLACLKNTVPFDEQDIATYSSSWNRAVVETERLFKHISELKPHSVQHTVSLNNARRIILELSEPLAEISTIIQRNIETAERKKQDVQASRKAACELQDQLYLDAIDLRHIQLDYPQTVCTHLNCIDHVKVSDNTQKIVYRQQCHKPCGLPGIPTETTNNTNIQRCAAIGGPPDFDCNQCGHSWKYHMHLTYDLERVNVRIIDKHVSSRLSSQQSDSEELEIFLQNVEKFIDDLKQEQQEITDICAQFGCYLKKNAITPFNDEVDAHLVMLIKNEKHMPDRNEKRIDNFESMRLKYAEKKKIITLAMERQGDDNVDYISEPQKVEELKERLFNLKINGPSLKTIFMEIKKSRSEYRYNETQVEPIRTARKRSTKGGLMQKVKAVGSYLGLSYSGAATVKR